MIEFLLADNGNDLPYPISTFVLAVRNSVSIIKSSLTFSMFGILIPSSSLISLLYHVFYGKALHVLPEVGVVEK